MKKIILFESLLVAGLLFFLGCRNSAESSGNSEAAGWYRYAYIAGDEWTEIFICFDSSGEIERAGSETEEYAGDALDTLRQTLTYEICRKNQSESKNKFLLEKIEEPPAWASGDLQNRKAKVNLQEEKK